MPELTDQNRWDNSLAKLDVPDTRYKPDLDLHDRAQSFSSEVLKLALAGIAVVGFLLANYPKERLNLLLDDKILALLFSGSVICFALSVGAALLQRFYAAGAMFHHLQVIKLSLLTDAAAESEITRNMQIRTRKFLIAHTLLKTTAGFLIVAAILISAAFIRMLFLRT